MLAAVAAPRPRRTPRTRGRRIPSGRRRRFPSCLGLRGRAVLGSHHLRIAREPRHWRAFVLLGLIQAGEPAALLVPANPVVEGVGVGTAAPAGLHGLDVQNFFLVLYLLHVVEQDDMPGPHDTIEGPPR